MNTIVLKVDLNNINQDYICQAAQVLKKGGLVAFPTETVYGLGANALDSEAASKIYSAKGRPSDNPLIVHISNIESLDKLTTSIPSTASQLITKFWPGPLTLVFNKKEDVPNGTTGGLSTVAIRMPSHPIARAIIEESGITVAAPSANISGKPSPTSADHVIEDLLGKVDMIIDGGKVNIGLESTVVDVTGDIPIILRPGYITKEMLEEVVGKVEIDQAILEKSINNDVIPKAPGMKYKHYAPVGELAIVEGHQQLVTDKINSLCKEKVEKGYKVGIIATVELKDRYNNGIVKVIGHRDNEEEIASNLFEVLREFDHIGVDYIYSESFSDTDLGQAIMNRLLKAAGYNIIKV